MLNIVLLNVFLPSPVTAKAQWLPAANALAYRGHAATKKSLTRLTTEEVKK
jgi:hypothetical protein